ncbi:hypothetical protein GJ496_008305 [Pomphorhynchus laevis]|nr:hypothetical protein GJ496_008305 [Pomphorhynchus laevis]
MNDLSYRYKGSEISINNVNCHRNVCRECGNTFKLCTPLKLTIHTDKTINIESTSITEDEWLNDINAEFVTNSSKQGSSRTTNANFVQYMMSLITPTDNKLSMKLFGSRRAVLQEKKRQEDEGRLIIHPCSTFRFYWDIVMLCLLIANVILLPLAISFFNSGNQSHYWTAFNILSDIFFIFDIIINFRTGIIVNNYVDEIILNPKQIAKHYLKGWFLVDLVSSFPIDYIFILLENKGSGYHLARTGRAIKAIRLFRLLSLLRLLRVSRLVRYASQWEEEFRSFFSVATIAMRIFNLIGIIVLIAHWNGCLQFLVPCMQDFPADSWVAINHLQNATWTKQYTLALFKALSHMLSIGYGRFPPQSYTDMWLTMLSMIVGAIVYATTIGHVSALVQSFDTSGRQYNEKIRKVEEYMLWRKLPKQLRIRILDYYEHRYQGKMFDESLILSELSRRLYLDVVNHNCKELVSSVPFFSNADQNFIDDIVSKLEFEMFQPGDIIIAEGSVGDKMYFILEGVLDIIKSNGEVLTTLGDGSYFGEISLVLKTKRTASVRAVTYCNLYSLSCDNVDQILEQFPAIKRTIAVIAAERLNKLGKDVTNLIHYDRFFAKDAKILADLVKDCEDAHKPIPDQENGDDNQQTRKR